MTLELRVLFWVEKGSKKKRSECIYLIIDSRKEIVVHEANAPVLDNELAGGLPFRIGVL